VTDEEYVRSKWEEVNISKFANSKPFWIASKTEYLGDGPFEFEEEMWSAARAFTEKREEEISQVKQELMFLGMSLVDVKDGEWHEGYVAVVGRILARTEARLADLKRGMLP
jgi:hypothetical protein